MGYLDIESLSKSFSGKLVLDEISFSVPKGGTIVLFGKSGAGKTVLLRSIAGVVFPESGTIKINGQNVTNSSPEHRGIGMAFQNFALFPHMTAFDNIASSLTSKQHSSTEIQRSVQDVAELLKIQHVLNHKPKALSNGQKQRTALARALVSEPSILLLDDPLRNVDAKLRFEMRLELPRLLANRGATVIYVTQDYKEAMALGDQIIVLDEGKIVQRGTPEVIYYFPQNTQIARMFGDPTINLIEVTPEAKGEGLQTKISGKQVKILEKAHTTVNQDCYIGLRPEFLSFAGEEGIPVTIEAVTPLNEKTITLVKTQCNQEILVSQPAQSQIPEGTNTYINFLTKNTLLFERSTGLKIDSGTVSPVQEYC